MGLRCHLTDALVVSSGDGSQGSMPRHGSQTGVGVFLCNPAILQGDSTAVLVEYGSSRIKRIMRSSMGAKVASSCTAFELGDYVRMCWLELLKPCVCLRRWQLEACVIPLYVVLDVTALRESIAEERGIVARWIPGPQQPSDELTKHASNGLLSVIASTGRWSLVETEASRKAREVVQQSRRDARHRSKAWRDSTPLDEREAALAEAALSRDDSIICVAVPLE